MALLKYKTDEGWKILYGGLLSKILRKDKNLSDLEDVTTAKENLGLIGDVSDPNRFNEEETHNHDSRYPLKSELQALKDYINNTLTNKLKEFVKKAGDTMTGALNFANNTWNKMGNDANIGDHNLAGKICIQGANGDTGLAMYQKGSETNYGTLNYNGTKFSFSKPVDIAGNTKVTGTFTATGNTTIQGNETVNGTIKAVGGFDPDRIDTPQLNAYNQKVNFIFGNHPDGANNHLTPFWGKSGCDYGGIVFGYPLTKTQGSWGGCITQLVTNGGNASRLLYRSKDSYTDDPWGAWKEIATTDDITNAVSKVVSITSPSDSIKQNGYIKFSNGLIIQWGKKLFNENNDHVVNPTVNFVQPFSSTVYAVVANGQRSTSGSIGGTYTYHMLSAQPTRTGFSIKSAIEKGSGSQYIHWIAIGK